MKIGIILTTKDYETIWNALRVASEAKNRNHEVKVFLMGEARDLENLTHNKFDVMAQISAFISAGGKFIVRGEIPSDTNTKEAEKFIYSAMNKCIDIIEWADKIVSF